MPSFGRALILPLFACLSVSTITEKVVCTGSGAILLSTALASFLEEEVFKSEICRIGICCSSEKS